MNQGSVQDWMNQESLDTRRMLAVMRDVAGALASWLRICWADFVTHKGLLMVKSEEARYESNKTRTQ